MRVFFPPFCVSPSSETTSCLAQSRVRPSLYFYHLILYQFSLTSYFVPFCTIPSTLTLVPVSQYSFLVVFSILITTASVLSTCEVLVCLLHLLGEQ